MEPGALKTTMWYKCLVCHTCFQFPKALVVHRMKSQCRFKYKEIHKERSKWPFETPLLDNLDQEEASRIKYSQQLAKSQQTISKVQETTGQHSNEAKASVPELSKKSRKLDKVEPHPLPRNKEQLKYNCYFCSSLFINFEDLQNHMMSHTREESDELKSGPLNPDNCKKNGMKSDELKSHKIPTSSKFICNFCQKSYCSKQYLNIHISTVHEKLKPHCCKQCPKSFSQSFHLRTHVSIVHENRILNSCKQCPKTFSTGCHLKRHISAVHQKLKPYSCKQCPKRFGRSYSLQIHVFCVHKKLRPYFCKQCPLSFGYSSNLRAHVSRVHEKLKPYCCKQCLKKFSTRGYLKIHTSTVHKRLRPYSCHQCPKSFGHLSNLRVHVSRVHKLEV